MSDDTTRLAELLDGSFGGGPGALPTPAERLADGHRALRRRRRLGVGGTTLAVVAVLGLVVGLRPGGDDPGGPPLPLATQSVAPATPSSSPGADGAGGEDDRQARRAERVERRQAQRLVSDQFPAALDSSGQVVVEDGWQVTRRVENPMRYAPPEASLGVVVTSGDSTRWMLLTLEQGQDMEGNPIGGLNPGASADDAGQGYSRFEDWLASMVELQGGSRTPPLVTVDGQDRLRPGPGAVLVDARPAPVIGGYTAPGDRIGEVRVDGRTWFVVVRGHGSGADVVPVDAAVLDAPTFAALVEHLRDTTASGEGVR